MNLTPREYEVARLYAEGQTWESIARGLRISKTTLWHHRANAMAKAGVGSMPELLTALGWLRVPLQTGMSGSGDSGEQRGAVESRGIDSPAVTPASLSLRRIA